MNLIELNDKILDWAETKGLDKANPRDQFVKVTEEVGEVAAGLARGDEAKTKDGIGDVTVTLIILAKQHGWTLEECLQMAYDEIADRKGEMVDGVFVKEDDLIANRRN